MNDQAALFPEIMLVLKSAHSYVDEYEQAKAEAATKNAIPQSGKR